MPFDGFHDSGATGQAEKAARVREMFDAMAPRYDLFNDVLSAGIHRRWRADALDLLAPAAGSAYLDLCAGTLDLARLVVARAPGARVVGADFSLPMLAQGRAKLSAPKIPVRPVAADALRLPFPDGAFRGVIIGFGLRNLADFDAGLREMARVLERGGRLVVLEFTIPPGRVFRGLYHAYFHHVLPRVGTWISGQAPAARYLPDSVSRFPRAGELAELVAAAGFERVRWRYLTRGIAALHVGYKV
ncbi:MAG TPA: ubiquinone/menaquinone biosynthesis methyltransferase [Gemmatimonadota bacterium]|nr:ubiquinone/menaquinone biosynthesis methyltransferase [Gemmatimonadota bacterium]